MTSYWYACAEPERPTDAFVVWHYENCSGCAVKADATARQYWEELTDAERNILDRIAQDT